MFPDAQLLPATEHSQLACLVWLDGAVSLCIASALTDLVFRVSSGQRAVLTLVIAAMAQSAWLLIAIELFGKKRSAHVMGTNQKILSHTGIDFNSYLCESTDRSITYA